MSGERQQRILPIRVIREARRERHNRWHVEPFTRFIVR